MLRWRLDYGQLELFSSRGPTDDGRSKPDLVAASSVSTSSYGRAAFEGTSAAAPHVSGVAALILERRPRARVETVREIMVELYVV